MRDYYMILGVRPFDNESVIRNAYRNLVKKYHPDVCRLDPKEAADIVSQLGRAYEVLSNPESRREYDNSQVFRMRAPRGIDKKVDVSSMIVTKRSIEAAKEERKRKSLWGRIKSMFAGSKAMPRDTAKAQSLLVVALSLSDQRELRRECKVQLAKAIEADPLFFEPRYDMAVICYKLGEYEEAVLNLKQCLKINPADKLANRFIKMLS